jgi:hypothetical protein
VSTVLESADHALQIKYGYLFTKLTFRSISEWLKKVSCAKLDLNNSYFKSKLHEQLDYYVHY